ncbi:MAG TPA: hypothetical protein VEQ61_08545 [Thermoleophilaceae bacterium]|nr:hypothetical protein [Thermoleophilaceae bacterium]
MPVLAMLELDGDTTSLMAAGSVLNGLLGTPEGLVARIVAPTESGVVLFQLWRTPGDRQRNADDPGHREALEASGMLAAATGTRSRTFEDAELQLFA